MKVLPTEFLCAAKERDSSSIFALTPGVVAYSAVMKRHASGTSRGQLGLVNLLKFWDLEQLSFPILSFESEP